MRVIAGSAKGTRLFAPSKNHLRPTSDRTKQVFFDTLLSISPLPEFVVDIFAGTGSLGIEALSRGVEKAIFVEKSVSSVRYLDRNLLQTHLKPRAQTLLADAFVFLRRNGNAKYAMIFADPPYGGKYSSIVMDIVANTDVLCDGGLLVLEETHKYDLHTHDSLVLLKEKRIGDTKLFFIEKKG